jgi:aminopeptidase N
LTPRSIARAARAVARGATKRNARTPWKSATTTCALLALLLLLLPAHADARDTYARHPELDAQQYRIRVRIDGETERIGAEAEIVFAVRAAGVREVPLDFAGLEVDGVEVNGRAARFTHAEQKFRVALPESLRPGDTFTVSVKYHGKPADGLYFKHNKFGDRTVFADNWPNRAHQWFPAIDHPYDKARVVFFDCAPARYVVVANGRLVGTTAAPDGTRLTHWREDVPVPVYCMVFGAAEFALTDMDVWGGVPLSYYVYPQERERGLRDYGRAPQMLDLYTTLVGPFPYEKLALVQSSTRFGGMENSSNIFFDENAYDGSGKLESTVAHEVAHQWFGDSVTEGDWHHLWLSEGFATYFAAIFFERAEGPARFRQMMLDAKDRYVKDADAVSRPVYDPSVTDLFKLLNRNNYEKGGWVLHMLRGLMGDEKFFAGVRDYYRTYRDGNALTEDFRRVMERHAGRPLEWFFQQWIYRPGFPALEAAWRWDAAAKRLRLTITQKQPGAAFRLPLEVEFEEGGAPRRERVELGAREQTFDFRLDGKPRGLRVDPDEWVLKTLSVREE